MGKQLHISLPSALNDLETQFPKGSEERIILEEVLYYLSKIELYTALVFTHGYDVNSFYQDVDKRFKKVEYLKKYHNKLTSTFEAIKFTFAKHDLDPIRLDFVSKPKSASYFDQSYSTFVNEIHVRPDYLDHVSQRLYHYISQITNNDHKKLIQLIMNYASQLGGDSPTINVDDIRELIDLEISDQQLLNLVESHGIGIDIAYNSITVITNPLINNSVTYNSDFVNNIYEEMQRVLRYRAKNRQGKEITVKKLAVLIGMDESSFSDLYDSEVPLFQKLGTLRAPLFYFNEDKYRRIWIFSILKDGIGLISAIFSAIVLITRIIGFNFLHY